MNNYTFNIDGKIYTRISKQAAKKAFNNGKTIGLLPCKANPRSIWISIYPFNKEYCENDFSSFESLVNSFEYYNCNSQLGKYTAFYSIE